MDFHVGAEDSAGDGQAGCLEAITKEFIETQCVVATGGRVEGRAAAFSRVGLDGEGADHEHSALRLNHVEVHLPGRIFEDSKTANLVGQMRAILQRVLRASVEVDTLTIGAIEKGLLLYLGVAASDQNEDAAHLSQRRSRPGAGEQTTGQLSRQPERGSCGDERAERPKRYRLERMRLAIEGRKARRPPPGVHATVLTAMRASVSTSSRSNTRPERF